MQTQLNFTHMSSLMLNVCLHGISGFSPVFVSMRVFMYEGEIPNSKPGRVESMEQ